MSGGIASVPKQMNVYDRRLPGKPIPWLRSVIINTASVVPVAIKHMLIDDIAFVCTCVFPLQGRYFPTKTPTIRPCGPMSHLSICGRSQA